MGGTALGGTKCFASRTNILFQPRRAEQTRSLRLNCPVANTLSSFARKKLAKVTVLELRLNRKSSAIFQIRIRIRETISARSIHDPRFEVSVNGIALTLASLPGADDPIKLTVPGCGEVEIILIDTQKSARTKQKQGFAFWVQNRRRRAELDVGQQCSHRRPHYFWAEIDHCRPLQLHGVGVGTRLVWG